MKKTFFASLMMALTFIPSATMAAPASRESVVKLMEITGAGNVGQQMLNQMQKMLPGASGEAWDKLMAGVKIEELTDLIVPIYQKHLTQEDVDIMQQFYATPTGKKLITSMPAIMQESMVAGQKWGQGIAYKYIQMQQAKSKQK